MKIYDDKGNVKVDIQKEILEPSKDIEVKVNRLQFPGKYSLVVHGREYNPQVTIILNQPKPWINLGKYLPGKGPEPSYSAPQKRDPRVLFLGEAPFEVYEDK